MTLSRPPAVAKWILENMRFENWSDALVGDLLETYRSQRKSKMWYRRQVFAAVVGGFLRELRNHWILAGRAVFIGLAVTYAAQMVGHEFFHLFRGLVERLHPVINEYSRWAIVSLFCGVAGGWVVAELHRKHRNAMLLIFACALVIWESIARFYISSFDLRRDLPFVCLFYPSALFGLWLGQKVLSILRASQA
jgi:hypothetical protein